MGAATPVASSIAHAIRLTPALSIAAAIRFRVIPGAYLEKGWPPKTADAAKVSRYVGLDRSEPGHSQGKARRMLILVGLDPSDG